MFKLAESIRLYTLSQKLNLFYSRLKYKLQIGSGHWSGTNVPEQVSATRITRKIWRMNKYYYRFIFYFFLSPQNNLSASIRCFGWNVKRKILKWDLLISYMHLTTKQFFVGAENVLQICLILLCPFKNGHSFLQSFCYPFLM